jgi:hypothetical protein
MAGLAQQRLSPWVQVVGGPSTRWPDPVATVCVGHSNTTAAATTAAAVCITTTAAARPESPMHVLCLCLCLCKLMSMTLSFG